MQLADMQRGPRVDLSMARCGAAHAHQLAHSFRPRIGRHSLQHGNTNVTQAAYAAADSAPPKAAPSGRRPATKRGKPSIRCS